VTLHSQWGNVPKNGMPDAYNELPLESGEQWITLSAQYDEKERHWSSKLSIPGGSIGSIIQPGDHWFDLTQTTAIADGVYNSTFVADPNARTVVLKRFRIGQVDNSAELEKNTGPTAGFIVWLERQ
jgi:hypothetical protein